MMTHVIFFIEGDTEAVLFPAIIQYYRSSFACKKVVLHIENLNGFGNYKRKAKGKLKYLLQKIKKEHGELKVVLCNYDTDVFDFNINPPIDWKQLKKEFEDITKQKNVQLIPIKSSIEDWLLSDIDGLCKFLRTKKKPKKLSGDNGYDKICHLFRQNNKSYYKGYECKSIIAHLDIAKIAAYYSAELKPIRNALGIE